jgi:hypothetical protein
MLCYKDMTFCADKVETRTCGRELIADDHKRAAELGLLIAYGNFCLTKSK